MFGSLVLHPQTNDALTHIIATPPHAVLLVGQDGIGKGTIALHVAAAMLKLPVDTLAESPAIRHIAPEQGMSISIEEVRSLQQFVKLKTTGRAALRRGIIVEHAGAMTTEAQNAFLKLLEEPPADTVIIMTTGHLHDLLPTIRSRTQHISITTPAKAAVTKHFNGYPGTHVMQAYFLSDGLPGLMAALLSEDQSHPLFESVSVAKQILQSTLFDRLIAIEPAAKDRAHAQLLCDALARIAQAGIKQASDKQDDKRLRQWHKILRETQSAQEALATNANTKLVLSNLLLRM